MIWRARSRMTSEPIAPQRSLAYLDANVLTAGITRTLLLLSAPLSDFRAVWSPYAEREAARHQPPAALPIAEVRKRYGLATVADASTDDLVDTDAKDRPILAAACAAGAHYVVTENVKDFGAEDLRRLSMSAVHPDTFLRVRLTRATYTFVLDAVAAHRTREPKAAAAVHAVEVSRKLPGLFNAHRGAYGFEPAAPMPGEARLQFRGVRCVRCGQAVSDADDLTSSGLERRCERS